MINAINGIAKPVVKNDWYNEVVLIDVILVFFIHLVIPIMYIYSNLGIIQYCFCIFPSSRPTFDKWLMKNYNVKQSWALLPYDVNRDNGAKLVNYTP